MASTNRELQAAIGRESFRSDLYYRLKVVTLLLAPLRERVGDVPLLAEHFLSRPDGPPMRLSDEALEMLEGYAFPGNVRELEHALEGARVHADGGVIRPPDLPAEIGRGSVAQPTAAEGAVRRDGDLYRRIVVDGESFWDVVRRPYLDRKITRQEVQDLVESAYEEAGRSYKRMAQLFGIEREHKRLLDFLRRHDLSVKS